MIANAGRKIAKDSFGIVKLPMTRQTGSSKPRGADVMKEQRDYIPFQMMR
jgi:hypothetical protein